MKVSGMLGSIMSNKKKNSDMLREKIKMAIGEQNIPIKRISTACDIHLTCLYAFLSGQRNISYDQLERVMSYLGLTLVPKKGFHFHSDFLEEKERKRQERIAAKRNE